MDSSHKLPLLLILFFFVITNMIPQAASQPRNAYKFPNNFNYSSCNDLHVLDSSLYWIYHPSSSSIDVAFKKNNAKQNRWIVWAINPMSKGMVGSQAFVAFKKPDGSMAAYMSPITAYHTSLQQGSVGFDVHGVSTSYDKDGAMIIFANFQLPGNSTLVNHVRQEGPVSDDAPMVHALSGPNVKSFGHTDFLTGNASDDDDGDWDLDHSQIVIRKIHGIMNGIGWGTLMPIGAMMARYLKPFDGFGTGSLWFNMHKACQIGAYFIGIAGFFIVVYIRNQNFFHGIIGLLIYALASAQILGAIFFMPHTDHGTRIFWNISHYVLGYGSIALAILNMFKGFSITNSYKMWRKFYFGIIVSLGCVALILEVVTWFLVCKKKKKKEKEEEDEEEEEGDEASHNTEEVEEVH